LQIRVVKKSLHHKYGSGISRKTFTAESIDLEYGNSHLEFLGMAKSQDHGTISDFQRKDDFAPGTCHVQHGSGSGANTEADGSFTSRLGGARHLSLIFPPFKDVPEADFWPIAEFGFRI
jgi:hypothetical protein